MTRLPRRRLPGWCLAFVIMLGGIVWPGTSHADQWTGTTWGPSCFSCHGTGTFEANTAGLSNLKTYSAFSSHVSAGFTNSPTMMTFKSAVANAVANPSTPTGLTDRDATELIRLYLLTALSSPVTAPTANAGPNQTVVRGRAVSLAGSGGSTYRWQLDSRPAGSSAALSSTTSATAGLTPDVVGTYNVSLIVTSATGVDSAPDRIVVTATANAAPTANAGA